MKVSRTVWRRGKASDDFKGLPIPIKDGEKRYILHPSKLKIGETVLAAFNAPISVGNTLPLRKCDSFLSEKLRH